MASDASYSTQIEAIDVLESSLHFAAPPDIRYRFIRPSGEELSRISTASSQDDLTRLSAAAKTFDAFLPKSLD